jgi:hypothetical protein
VLQNQELHILVIVFKSTKNIAFKSSLTDFQRYWSKYVVWFEKYIGYSVKENTFTFPKTQRAKKAKFRRFYPPQK